MVNIICMKWGTLYGAEYVNKLYSMVERNLTKKFRFICFTEDATDIRKEVEIKDLPDLNIPPPHERSPWRKLTMFANPLSDLTGKTLFLDLDVVILDNIDCFFEYSDKFAIIENWTQKGQGVGNSSVYCLEAGKYVRILEEYKKNTDQILKDYDNEQIFLSKTLGEEVEFWPDDWCKSFKRHAIPKGIKAWFQAPQIPKGTKIMVFHGNPKPEHAIKGIWPGKFLKHVCKTPWVEQHWK